MRFGVLLFMSNSLQRQTEKKNNYPRRCPSRNLTLSRFGNFNEVGSYRQQCSAYAETVFLVDVVLQNIKLTATTIYFEILAPLY